MVKVKEVKDHIRNIARQIASGKTDEIGPAIRDGLRDIDTQLASLGNRLSEIQEDITALKRQKAVMEGFLALYVPGSVAETGRMKPVGVPHEVAPDGLSPNQRSHLIREAALELVREGKTVLSAGDVIGALAQKGIQFGVKRPNSMAGTVISGMPEFDRIGPDRFSYVDSNGTGTPSQFDQS